MNKQKITNEPPTTLVERGEKETMEITRCDTKKAQNQQLLALTPRQRDSIRITAFIINREKVIVDSACYIHRQPSASLCNKRNRCVEIGFPSPWGSDTIMMRGAAYYCARRFTPGSTRIFRCRTRCFSTSSCLKQIEDMATLPERILPHYEGVCSSRFDT